MHEEPHERLREARQAAGFATAGEAAERFRWTTQTYRAHENGSRGFRPTAAKIYARAFKVSPQWLLYGTGDRTLQVPLVAEVGAGAEVLPINDHAEGGAVEYVDPPPEADPDMVAVRVTGWSMYPAHWPGDILFYRNKAQECRALIGHECIVTLEDGRAFVKILENGSEKHVFDLASYNAPPMRDQHVTWCAPIEWVDKRHRYQRA